MTDLSKKGDICAWCGHTWEHHADHGDFRGRCAAKCMWIMKPSNEQHPGRCPCGKFVPADSNTKLTEATALTTPSDGGGE